jgi:hypothetical protein
MDFHALRAGGDVHIMSTHRGQDDETPLHLISEKQLTRYAALELAVQAFADAVAPLLPSPLTQHAPDNPEQETKGI